MIVVEPNHKREKASHAWAIVEEQVHHVPNEKDSLFLDIAYQYERIDNLATKRVSRDAFVQLGKVAEYLFRSTLSTTLSQVHARLLETADFFNQQADFVWRNEDLQAKEVEKKSDIKPNLDWVRNNSENTEYMGKIVVLFEGQVEYVFENYVNLFSRKINKKDRLIIKL